MPLAALRTTFDPLVRLLLLAIVLASVLPVRGTAHDVAQYVSNAAIFVLFLLNGLRLPRAEVIRGIGHWRLLAPLVLWCFGAMALAGLGLWRLTADALPPAVALGFLYLGTLPSTVQSATAYSSIAGGDVAISVVAAALLNVLGVFVTAPLFALLGGGDAVSLGTGGLVKIGTILLLPFALGQLLQNRAGHMVRDHRVMAMWMDRTSIALAVYVAFSAAVDQGIWTLIGARDWLVLLGRDRRVPAVRLRRCVAARPRAAAVAAGQHRDAVFRRTEEHRGGRAAGGDPVPAGARRARPAADAELPPAAARAFRAAG